MNEVKFFTTFRFLEISQPIFTPLQLMPGIFISNQFKLKKQFLDENSEYVMGKIEMDHYQQSPNIIFGTFDKEYMAENNLDTEKFLYVIIAWLNLLLRDLWLIKDHCIECDSAYLIVPKNKREAECSKNYLTILPSLADGSKNKKIKLTYDELVSWIKVHDLVGNYLAKTNSTTINFLLDKNVHRTGRAMQFILTARSSENLAFRISHYCSAFESLFSNDTSELSHKLSERAAFFLSAYGFNRREIFKKLKEAYAVRSKLTHGGNLTQKQIDDLPKISLNCDNYLRAIMNIIYSDGKLRDIFDLKRDSIEIYFEEIIFGL